MRIVLPVANSRDAFVYSFIRKGRAETDLNPTDKFSVFINRRAGYIDVLPHPGKGYHSGILIFRHHGKTRVTRSGCAEGWLEAEVLLTERYARLSSSPEGRPHVDPRRLLHTKTLSAASSARAYV